MPLEGVWADPRTWVAIAGFLFGVLSFRWNRRENRLDALSKILHPMVKTAQELHEANHCRQCCEILKRSFPVPESAPEAAERVKMLVDDYGEHVKAARDEFRAAEAEFASRSFRFPGKVTALVQRAIMSLAEFGQLVNDGMFDKADLKFATFKDDYAQITKVGRGWRLADPLEGVRRYFRKKKKDEAPEGPYDLSEKDMNEIMALVHKRATSQVANTFAVHPPRKLLERPEIAKSDKVIEELGDSVFVVAFQDGTSRMMSLVELMVFTYNLIVLAYHGTEVARMMEAVPPAERHVSVSLRFSIDQIMRPEMVQMLLSKIAFSKEPSDADASPEAA